MIGVDTNILVRYMTQDDAVLSPKASALIENRLSAENPGFVSVVVMAEIASVLGRSYSLPANELADAIECLLSIDVLIVEYSGHVFSATRLMRKGHDFADALLALLAQQAGCTRTVTFDKRASRLPGFELLT